MAGFVFSIDSKTGIDGLKKRIELGNYAASIPLDLGNKKSMQIAASVLADYCSMKSGDNVYFLSKRCIYGVGVLCNIGNDCKYKNYLRAHTLTTINSLTPADAPLVSRNPSERWVCFFKPERDSGFFEMGVDMDDALSYRPYAFRMLRAFQDRSFIKIDDEENSALKEYLYLRNKECTTYFAYSSTDHTRIERFALSNYIIKPKETIVGASNHGEVGLEMLLEAFLVDDIQRHGFERQTYDYVSHQIIASPFKPIAYIDKIDILAYKYLDNAPADGRPIEQYLIIELKKSKANEETFRQTMRYVDWISREYASGDYSLIKAAVVAKEYKNNIYDTLVNECTRRYIARTHPNVSAEWDGLSLYEYDVNTAGEISLKKYDAFNAERYLVDKLESFGWKVAKTEIRIDSNTISPRFKIQKKKIAFFAAVNPNEAKLLSKGWRVYHIDSLTTAQDVENMIKEILE